MAPSSSAAATTSVQVALRIRPATKQDANTIPTRFQRTIIHAVSNQVVSVDPVSATQTANGSTAGPVAASSTPTKKQTFAFDQVLGPETTQYELWKVTAAPLLSRFLEGFNCTILAYGQTSSGKTHSMTGVDLDADPSDPSNGMGIIPRSISEIFSRAAALKEERAGVWSYSIKGSFIELYNEELIDLLSYDDTGGGRREVQIREDKHGHIIWDGLREVSVRNTNEVMNLIRQGTSIRRTNETDMNAQSSRSHAIFSLTLTQRKYTGSGLPPRSTTPVSGSVRSPSRLARPVSHQFNSVGASTRVSSPTFGRPPTPSFAAAMGRGGTLRPSSAMGSHASDGKAKNVDDENGEWITVVSKFHFVDLAGSERLKRTAAAGERVKEGISINSGLLALGNVISALGDPSRAKSHTASHVPYRDSKLTRLLQDSLGGNAHTLMVACVSSAEWNASETVNTLKYANRARNIKNRAVVNEKEEGWDDLEWLQNMVTRLRKEVKGLKEGGASSARGDTVEMEGASKKVLTQMVDLQTNYEDLRAKFVERTEELTRLRRELGEKQRNSTSGAVAGTAKYEEIVGPVIEEYEKTISAMEAELSLNRAALRHTNDLVEEKEEELSQLSERHTATEMYVEELKSRVGKLVEREASTEAYIRDLEEKIKHQEDTTISSSESVTDLKREIARFKENEGQSARYIAEVEGRLARRDESILTLRAQVEKLENETESKRGEVEVLQARLDSILNDGEAWRSDLEEREKRVRDLELKMEEWQSKRAEASSDRTRLREINAEVQHARRSLELDMAQTAKAIKIVYPGSDDAGDEHVDESDESLTHQLKSLRETHAATLADLSSVTSKYRDALKEISELTEQINEIKLESPSRSDSPERASSSPVNVSRRRPGMRSREPSEGQANAAGRQLFFRQAASTESLRSRSLSQSQSLSQELFSARSRMLSSPEVNGLGISGVNTVYGHANRHSPGGLRPNLSISLPIGPGHERSVPSLEKEIMRLQEVLKEREAEITTLESTLRNKERSSKEHSDIMGNGHRDSQSDLSPRIMNQINAIRKSMEIRNPPSELAIDNEPLDRLNELMLSMAQKEAQHREEVEELNEQLDQIRRQHDDLTKLSRDQALNMSTELEALRTEHHDVLVDIDALRQREVHLLEERTALEEKHEENIKQLQAEHEQALRDKQAQVDSLLESVKAEHEKALQEKEDVFQSTLESAKSEYEQVVNVKHAESAALSERSSGEHEQKLAELHNQLADASEALTKSKHDHEEAFGKLQADHEEELRRLREEVDMTLAQTKDEHEVQLAKLISEHESVVKEKEDTLHRTEEEYYQALSKLRADQADVLAKKEADMQAAIERLKEEHAGALKMADLAKEGSLTESQSQQADLLKLLQDEHTSAIEKKEVAFAEDLRRIKEEHASALEEKQLNHSASIERLKSKHATRLAELEDSKNLETDALQKTLAKALEQQAATKQVLLAEKEEALQQLQQQHADLLVEVQRSHEESVSKLKEEHRLSREQGDATHEEALLKLREQHAEVLSELGKSHDEESGKLRNELEASQNLKGELESSHSHSEIALKEVQVAHQEEIDALLREKTEEILKLRAEHQQIIADFENTKVAALEQHRQDLENARGQNEALLVQERERLTKALADAEANFSQERETLRKDHELLLEEVTSYKAAADDYVIAQEETRRTHADALAEKDKAIASLRENAESMQIERLRYESELDELRKALEASQSDKDRLAKDAAQRGQLSAELERQRQVLTETQTELQKTKEHRDNLLAERSKQEAGVREVHARPTPLESSIPSRTGPERRAGMSKLPPLTPPPSVPPPPAPRSIPPLPSAVTIDVATSVSSQSNTLRSSASSRDSNPESPATSTDGTSVAGTRTDPKVSSQLVEQAKQIEEQEIMIKTLNKQLTHCESDLQAHMDLVSTLETSLGDSEKNLRKARMQATELARERDTLNTRIDGLRRELEESRRELTVVRRSVIEEKQSLESRLDEERRAKERVRQQLDMRVEELQKRKSKFVCL